MIYEYDFELMKIGGMSTDNNSVNR